MSIVSLATPGTEDCAAEAARVGRRGGRGHGLSFLARFVSTAPSRMPLRAPVHRSAEFAVRAFEWLSIRTAKRPSDRFSLPFALVRSKPKSNWPPELHSRQRRSEDQSPGHH